MGLMRLQRWPGSHGQPGKKNIVSCGVGAWQRGVDKVAGSTPALFPEHDGARWESGTSFLSLGWLIPLWGTNPRT